MFSIDSSTLIVLYKKYRLLLISSIAHLTGCREIAAELAQEAYIRLLVNGSHMPIIAPEAYLFRIGRNLAVDYRRSSYGKIEFLNLDENVLCPLLSPDEMAALRQQCELLIDAVATMPRSCCDVFLLRKIDELSFGEIAARLGISEKTVQRRLVRAMLHCHQRLQ